MRPWKFSLLALAVGAIVFALALAVRSDYLFFAGYVVLQFIVLATAWNILGGYCGYVNFGSAAFFAVGAYSSVAMHKLAAGVDRYFPESIAGFMKLILPLNIPTLIILGGIMSGLVGLGTGYLTLRLRGAFFAIATLALAVVLQTLIINWNYVGGARGAYVIRPAEVPLIGPYVQYLFLIQPNEIALIGPYVQYLVLPYVQYLFLLMLALAVIALTIA